MEAAGVLLPTQPEAAELWPLDPPTDEKGELYALDQGVYIRPGITQEELEGFELNPIVEPVEGLGRVCLESVRHTKEEGVARIHRLYSVEINGYKQAMEVTDPADGEATYTLFSVEGLTEHIQGGVRKSMQARLAHEFPRARIVSVESDGLGNIGERYNPEDPKERDKHSFEVQASQRLVIAKATSGDKPVILNGTSMGVNITDMMVHENTYGSPAGGRINIEGQTWNVTAAIPPERIAPDMTFIFLPQVAIGLAKGLLRCYPREVLRITKTGLLQSGFTKPDVQVMYHQIHELLRGVKEDYVNEVVAAAPTSNVTGERDVLRYQPMNDRLKATHGDLFQDKIMKGWGHEAPMNPPKNAALQRRVADFIIAQTLGLEPAVTTK
jgi:hypothetical protein